MSETDPRRLRLALGFSVGFWASVSAVFVAVDVEPGINPLFLLWIAGWAGLGAGPVAFRFSRWVGRGGLEGWARAFAAAVLCTLCGGFMGGGAFFPPFGGVFGPPVALAMIVAPKFMPLWWGGFVLIQLLALWLRARWGAGRS